VLADLRAGQQTIRALVGTRAPGLGVELDAAAIF
jgi:hypothetical protein